MRIKVEKKESILNFSNTMTDISFLLIIFFIIAAVFIVDYGLFIILPEKNSKPLELKPDEAIEIIIPDYKRILIDGISTTASNNSINLAILNELAEKTNPVAIIKISKGITYQYVLEIVEAIKSSGISTFSLITETEPKPVEIKED